jgi:hypothetical protein
MVGTHGMTLFGGAEKLYVSHIPLYQAPHAKQLILEVAIASGVPANAANGPSQFETQFATNNFTVEPAKMSLADLAAGRLTRFTGTIYFGNFEAGGKPLYPNVTFDVKRVVFDRALSNATPRSATLDYVAVGTPKHAYLVHVVDAAPSFDNVVAATSTAPLAEGTIVTVTGGTNDVTKRLGNAVAINGGQIAVERELGCLPGPEFAGSCPPLPEGVWGESPKKGAFAP